MNKMVGCSGTTQIRRDPSGCDADRRGSESCAAEGIVPESCSALFESNNPPHHPKTPAPGSVRGKLAAGTALYWCAKEMEHTDGCSISIVNEPEITRRLLEEAQREAEEQAAAEEVALEIALTGDELPPHLSDIEECSRDKARWISGPASEAPEPCVGHRCYIKVINILQLVQLLNVGIV